MQLGDTQLRERWERFVRKVDADPDAYERLTPDTFPPLQVYCGGQQPSLLYFMPKDILCRRWLHDGVFPGDWMVMSRHTIPGEIHLRAIVAQVECFEVPLLFVGDLDPFDLTIFATIRASLRASEAAHLPLLYAGVDDRWLALNDQYRLPGFSGEDTTMRMGPLEREHFALVRELVPDLESLVGPRSLRMLESGLKLEIEAACGPGFYGDAFPTLLIDHLRALIS